MIIQFTPLDVREALEEFCEARGTIVEDIDLTDEDTGEYFKIDCLLGTIANRGKEGSL